MKRAPDSGALFPFDESASDDAASLDQVDDQDDDRDHEQDMNEAADGVTRNQSEHPEDEQYDEDGPKHRFALSPFRGALSGSPGGCMSETRARSAISRG